jgi:hypothetical protein
MAVYVEKPEMLPRVTVHGDKARMAYINSKNKQVCLELNEVDLAFIATSIIKAQDVFQQRRIDGLNREIAVP